MLSVSRHIYRLREPLGISRGSIGATVVVRVEISDGNVIARGECCPTYRNGAHSGGVFGWLFGESDVTEMARLWTQKNAVRTCTDITALRTQIQTTMKPGAARNAVDCALWDLEAKKTNVPVWQRLRHEYADVFSDDVIHREIAPLTICATVGLGTPSSMAEHAAQLGENFKLLKIKLGGMYREGTDAERLRAIRASVPTSRLIVDANEGWTEEGIIENVRACEEVGVELIEQPVPEGCEDWLQGVATQIPFCADESFHIRTDIERVATYYQAVNIKLDKAGGLTEALECAREAKKCGLKVMSGCMLGTSLSVAPQFYLAQCVDYVDADCAYLLEENIEHAMRYDNGQLYPPSSALWG